MIGMIVASFPIILSRPSVSQTLGAEQLARALNTDSSKRLVQTYAL